MFTRKKKEFYNRSILRVCTINNNNYVGTIVHTLQCKKHWLTKRPKDVHTVTVFAQSLDSVSTTICTYYFRDYDKAIKKVERLGYRYV